MNEPKPLPSETPRSDEAYILRLLGRIADQERALASLADELRLAREEQIALLRFIQKEHPVTREMWSALFPKKA